MTNAALQSDAALVPRSAQLKRGVRLIINHQECCMNLIRNIIFIYLMSFSLCSFGAEFPAGNYKGIGFIVEKGSMKITEADMSIHESQLTVTKMGESKVAFKISVKMQRYPNTPIQSDNRYDVYNIKWDGKNSGLLINNNKKYSGDKTTFDVDGRKLTVKSWISRNQLFETHIYEKQ